MNGLIQKLTVIPEVDAVKALEIMGGIENLYERVLRLTARMLPEHIEDLNRQMTFNHDEYTITVHGVKGALNSIGAYQLGKTANKLEIMAKNNDYEACEAHHEPFIKELGVLSGRLNELLEEKTDKIKGDTGKLAAAAINIADALREYNRSGALEYLTALQGLTFGEERDRILEKVIHNVERFDYGEALLWIEELQNNI